MAVPTRRRDSSSPAGPAPDRRLLDHAVGLLVDHVADPHVNHGGWRFGPLVIVSTADGSAAEAVREAAAARGATLAPPRVATWEGESLDREIAIAIAGDRLGRLAAALAVPRLVVVDRIDRIADEQRREALALLLEASLAAGTAWCVSVARLPADGLGPRCATRLAAGLVVTAPPRTPRGPDAGTTLPLGRVIRAAARYHDVPVAAVLGPSRRRTVTAARSLAMLLARRLTGRSLQAIGAACGGRDHTTVLHGVRVCGARIASDPAFAADVDRIAAELAGRGGPGSAGSGRRRSRVGSAPLGAALSSRHRGRRRQA